MRDVVGNGEQFESRQRPDDRVDLVALDQFLRFCFGACGVAAGVCRNEFNFPPRERVVLLLKERDYALFHLDAALSERAGFDREQGRA